MIMLDKMKKKSLVDAKEININELEDIFYWTQVLGVPRDKLIAIVEKIGNSTVDIKKALKR